MVFSAHTPVRIRTLASAAVVLAAITMAACSSVGPQTVHRDSFEYTDALGTAWKEQMLLNMVKIRYGDAPVFLQVASMINQYSLDGQVNISSPGWDRPSGVGPPIAGATGRWADRPTITYIPMNGEQFTRAMLSPIPPVSLLVLVQSRWPAEFVFGIATRTINGVTNGTRAPLLRQDPAPRFGELLKALTEIQRSDSIGIRIDQRPDGNVAVVVLQQDDPGGVAEYRGSVREILGLGADVSDFRLEYRGISNQPDEIAILTRSVLEILGEFSFGIEVPQTHLDEGRTLASAQFDGPWSPPSIRVQSSEDKPEDAFVAIRYRDLWFWIDDRDFRARQCSSENLVKDLRDSPKMPAPPLSLDRQRFPCRIENTLVG